MKKYKVITDHLEWMDIKMGDIIEDWENKKSYPVQSKFGVSTWIEECYLRALLELKGEWFEEIKDAPKEKKYTQDDIADCLSYYRYHIEGRSRLERNMKPFSDYVDEWLEARRHNKTK